MSASLSIQPVDDAAALARFIQFPYDHYRADPNWVPPLRMDRKDSLSPKHPLFQHVQWQGFLALRGGEVVGRISAQIDDRYPTLGVEGLGQFGMLDAVDDAEVYAGLLEAAEGWLKAKGCTRAEGPFSLGVNQELGLLVDGFDTPPFFLMAHGPRWAAKHVEAAGYDLAQTLLAYQVHCEFDAPRAMTRMLERAGNVRFRPIDPKRAEDEFRAMCGVFNDAWSNNWRFVPFGEEELIAIGKEMLLVTKPDLIQIAEIDGEPVAFGVMLPNINEAIADLDGRLLPFGWAKLLWRMKVKHPSTGRVPLMGVRKAHQAGRLGAALAFGVIEGMRRPAAQVGMGMIELSWILEDNLPMRHMLEAIGGHVTKRYHMYGRDLPAS